MADRKDTDVHKPDGIVFPGEKVGHADRESHIRRRDGLIFKGDEVGYVDRDKNIRRPDGIIFRGDVVGQIKGTHAHAKDGIVFPGEEWGYVDDDGNIRQRDGIIFRGRIIGKMRGHNKEAALGFYVLRFNDLLNRFNRLEQEARDATAKGRYLGKVRHMLEYVPGYDGLGDFDDLLRRLKSLEDHLVTHLDGERDEHKRRKEALIRDAERWSSSTEWKTGANEIKALQQRWKETGSVGKDDDELWHRFRSTCDRFFERRTAYFDAMDRERKHNAERKHNLIAAAEQLQHASDTRTAVAQAKELQATWKTIGPAPKDQDNELYQRFRHACDAVFTAAQRAWERRHNEYEERNAERERKHEEWERKQREWREKMTDTLRAKREHASRLRESIAHDEGNVSRWRETIDDLRPGGRADEIRDSLETKIADVEDRISSKETKLREIADDIQDIEAKLRQ